VVRARPRRPDFLAAAGATPGPQGQRRAAPHSHADSGGPAPRGPAAVPGNKPRPVPILVRSHARGHSKGGGLTSAEGGASSARLTAGAGRQAMFLLRGCGPAGVGRTWDGASAPSPYSVRQPCADLVSSPDPPPGRGPVTAPRSAKESGAAGVPSKRLDAGAAAQDTRDGLVVQPAAGCHR
jgi:hypothetical protein